MSIESKRKKTNSDEEYGLDSPLRGRRTKSYPNLSKETMNWLLSSKYLLKSRYSHRTPIHHLQFFPFPTPLVQLFAPWSFSFPIALYSYSRYSSRFHHFVITFSHSESDFLPFSLSFFLLIIVPNTLRFPSSFSLRLSASLLKDFIL